MHLYFIKHFPIMARLPFIWTALCLAISRTSAHSSACTCAVHPAMSCCSGLGTCADGAAHKGPRHVLTLSFALVFMSFHDTVTLRAYLLFGMPPF